MINGGDTLQLGDKTSDLSLDRVFGVGSELEGTWDNGGELWSFDSDAGTYEIEDGGGNITEEGNFVLVDNDERIRFLRTSVLDKR